MMSPENRIETEALPRLREQLAGQFDPVKRQHSQVPLKKRNLLMIPLYKLKNWAQNIIAFVFTLIFLIPLWLFKIGLRFLDLVERGIRYIIWLNIKSLVSWINFMYRILAFFRVNKAVKFFQHAAQKYFRKYSSANLQRQDEQISRLQLIMRKRQHDLIDVKKVQHKIKTPNIFITHQQSKKPSISENQREQYVENINNDLVPERTVRQNIVSPRRIKSPTLLRVGESHERLQKATTQPAPFRSPRMEQQISTYQDTSKSQRISPDRDISPERYMKQIPKIGEFSFKKKQSPQRQILMTHHKPIVDGSQIQKQQLQLQLLTLRTKMSELINDNNRDIQELQEWIREKSQTIMMTRKQNLELLQEIQKLQRQNVKKTGKLAELQQKVKQMQGILQKQKITKNGLNEQVQKLQQQIKAKTIEIMSLKQKIRTNFKHLQQMENIFGHERIDLSKQPQDQTPYSEKHEIQPHIMISHSLKSDLKPKQVNLLIPEQADMNQQVDYSNIQTRGSNLNEQIIDEQFTPSQTNSEKQKLNDQTMDQKDQQLSVKTNPLENQLQKQKIDEKIKIEEQRTAELGQKVQQALKQQSQRLDQWERENPNILSEKLPEMKLQAQKIEQPEQMDQKQVQNETLEECQNEQNNEVSQDKKKKNKKKKNQPKFIKNEGKSKITMTKQ